MISVKYALIIVAAFAAGAFFTSPVPQAIAAVIATDVQCTGCVGASDLASSAVTSTKLASSAVTSTKITSNAVTSSKIADGTVAKADLAANSVDSSKIVDGSVQNVDLGNGVVTNTNSAANAVTGDKVTDETITYPDVSKNFIAVEHRDDCNCGGTGWDPDGTKYYGIIFDDRITPNSVVSVSYPLFPLYTCGIQTNQGYATVYCPLANAPIPEGTSINYAIFNHQ